ncbi:MAG TPA: hypothetical protein VMH23_13325 [Bacteroidota bacterium]|nr:hypothetical protein [Bacteroidota bacterium]
MGRHQHEGHVRRIAVMLCMVFIVPYVLNAQAASYGQQVAVAKALKPGLTTLGIFATNLSDKAIEQISRAAAGQGVKVVVAKPQDAGQVSAFYTKLVSEKKAELIWLPDASDNMLLGIGFEFLRAKALGDKVGLIVPQESLVASGGLCTVQLDGGKVKVIVNQKIAQMIGLSVPSDAGESITYVSR